MARDTIAVQQLLTHVPDIVINCDHKKLCPYVEKFTGVCLFADISGKQLKYLYTVQDPKPLGCSAFPEYTFFLNIR